MLQGYNTNVPFKGKMFHVQTEDGGRGNPVVVTLLYEKGVILDSVRSTYADVLIDDDWKDKVIDLMKKQHKAVIQAVMSGKYAEEEPEGTTIDDLIVEYLVKPEKQRI